METLLEQILQQLVSIQSWINSVNSNSKKIHELELTDTIIGGNFIPVSKDGQTYRININTLASYINKAVKAKENTYPDLATMFADQVNQTVEKLQFVEDSTGDPESGGGYAYYEYLGTTNGNIDDYRLLSDEEVGVVVALEGFNRFNVEMVNTTVADTVSAGNVLVEYENVGDKVTAIIFDPIFTMYLKAFEALGLGYVFQVYNTTLNKTLVAKVTDIVYSDVDELCYRVEFEATMSRLDVAIGNSIEIFISVYDATTSGVSSVTGALVDNTDPSNPVINLPALADLDTSVTGAQLDAMYSQLSGLDQALVLKGTWDASSGSFAGGGTAQAGWFYIVSVAGTVDGVEFNVNDRLIALVDNASTTTFTGNWHHSDESTFSQEVGNAGAITAPDDADLFGVLNSLASFITAKITWANIKTAMRTYLQAFFEAKLNVKASASIATSFTVEYSYKMWNLHTMTGDTTFEDSSLVVDGVTRVMYLTGDFVPTFPSYWEPDQDSQAYDGTQVFRMTWDVLNATASSEDVRYFMKQIS